MIDLRSDTVTRPTAEMMEAMMAAKVGDDVFAEDPTVIDLEEKAATLFNKESALFCPSGTMTNQIAIKLHTQPGDEVLCDELAHIYLYEGGGIGFNSGASIKLISGDRGRFTADDVLARINPDDIHFPTTRLVSAENTCNKGGGCYYQLNDLQKIGKTCRENNLAFHLDGARLFNALVETGENASDYGDCFDTVSICLSKGLGAPVGSLLIGTREHIKKARRIRKVFGGGMRQAGILAAAGIYALDHNIDRLKEDHQRAQQLENAIQELPYVSSTLPVETNIVVFTLSDDVPQNAYLEKIQQKGIKAVPFGHQRIRLVTHLDFGDDQLSEAISILQQAI